MHFSSPTVHATCPTTFNSLDLIILLALVRNTEYKALLYAVFYSLLSLTLFGPMYFLSTPFLNTLSLCSSFCARNRVYSSVYFNPYIRRQHIGDKVSGRDGSKYSMRHHATIIKTKENSNSILDQS